MYPNFSNVAHCASTVRYKDLPCLVPDVADKIWPIFNVLDLIFAKLSFMTLILVNNCISKAFLVYRFFFIKKQPQKKNMKYEQANTYFARSLISMNSTAIKMILRKQER